jgi:L-ribulose-5-phosphate 3-epimerase
VIRIGAITDEFSHDPETAARAMRAAGLETAELRVLWGRNILDLNDAEIDRALGIFEKHRLAVDSIASPLLKCTLPDAPELDARFQKDVFASRHTYADQPRLAERSMQLAKRSGAGIVRVFSYWRTVDPEAVFERVVRALRDLANQAEEYAVIVGLENEHACNISTGLETARVLAAVDHPNLKVVWDPANALVAGEDPMKGLTLLSAERIGHVHVKDCRTSADGPEWVAVGDGRVRWEEQIAALRRENYKGDINLETHWLGPNGDKLEASRICAANLRKLVAGCI